MGQPLCEVVIAAMEINLMTVDSAAATETDAARAHAIVEALENARRSLTTVLETWRAREVELVGSAAPSDDERTVLKVVKKPKIRWDHDRIGERVSRRALFSADGEMLESRDIAIRACHLMRELYVSPATEPKKSALALIGIEEPMSVTLAVEEGTARVQERVKR